MKCSIFYFGKAKAFTLIELLAVIVILAIIALIATPIIIGLIDNARKESFKASSYGIIDSAGNGFAKTLLNQEAAILTEYQYNSGEETRVQGNINLNYNGKKPQNGKLFINEIGQTALAFYENGYCVTKGYDDTEITLEEMAEEDCIVPEDVPVLGIYDESQGVNRPQLADGMIPVMYYGGNWVKADITNQSVGYEWYGYTNAEKKWANAVTVNDSNRETYLNASVGTIIPMVDINAMWVWIPRYIYKITSGWHTNSVGTIMVQFSKAADDNWNNVVIGNINTNPGANASNNTWTNQPAFTFGGDELTGFWVAKFRASGTDDDISILPNVLAHTDAYIDTAFAISRTLETKSKYGWGTSGTDIDTHLTKNVEWGAIIYLSQTSYGINGPVGINTYNVGSGDMMNGCGAAPGSTYTWTATCNAYNTASGMMASTTGNIYGIYDISGIGQHVAAYPNYSVARSGLSAMLNADSKYKDIYETTDDVYASDVYTLSINHKGDALYETSASSPFTNFPPLSNFNDSKSSWYGGSSAMAGGYRYAYIDRGNIVYCSANTGIYSFSNNEGAGVGSGYIPFRPILVVGEGL